MDEDFDLRLRALLRSPERRPDEGFARRMQRLVLAEERMRAARRAAWRRFAIEMIAAAALILVFVVLAKAGPAPDSGRIVPLFGPASAGLLLLALWVIVSCRPGSGASAD
jgi:predicted nucleic acid-binding Zn ribbon protein